MLNCDERLQLAELLRPPPGFKLDHAIGTSYSLDLLTALRLPLSFASFDWETADGMPREDPLALLESLRRYGDKLTIFCQAAQIHLPTKYSLLVTWLEKSIYQVQLKQGIFHPKVWVLRFEGSEGAIKYRMLCLTRNITFCRCWDAVVSLDGPLVDRELAISDNHPLADFIAQLPRLVKDGVPDERRRIIARIADELKRVKFEIPEGFEEYRFWHGGLEDSRPSRLWDRSDKSLIISPFASEQILDHFSGLGSDAYIISRQETLSSLKPEAVKAFTDAFYLDPDADGDEGDIEQEPDTDEPLVGLHAKIFVLDHGWKTSVFCGSFNATSAAFRQNVEFMVELIGKRSRFGVDKFLEHIKGESKFVELLQEFKPAATSKSTDPVDEELESAIRDARTAIASVEAELRVVQHQPSELYSLILVLKRACSLAPTVSVRCWPITLPSTSAAAFSKTVEFEALGFAQLTPLLAFEITARIKGHVRTSSFVVNMPLVGAPLDRRERILATLIEDKDKLLQYILFMMAADDENFGGGQELLRMLSETDGTSGRSEATPPLLETLLRSLHRDPNQIDNVATVLADIAKVPAGSALMSEEFRSIWDPIWKARMEISKP